MNKDRTLYWLNRRIKELEVGTTPPSAEAMAEAGIPYDRRQQHLSDTARLAESRKPEIEAMRELRDFVMENAR